MLANREVVENDPCLLIVNLYSRQLEDACAGPLQFMFSPHKFLMAFRDNDASVIHDTPALVLRTILVFTQEPVFLYLFFILLHYEV